MKRPAELDDVDRAPPTCRHCQRPMQIITGAAFKEGWGWCCPPCDSKGLETADPRHQHRSQADGGEGPEC